MSFADQRGMLRSALIGAGLSPDAASNIANILANSAQDSLASSRTRTDTTPDGLRLVGPDDRKMLFQNLDFLPGDPDHRPQRVASSEQRDPARPPPNVTEKIAPQQTTATYRVAGGNLSDASGAGDAVEVNVRSRIAKQPSGGLPLTMMDRQTNTLVGKAMRASAGGDDARVRVNIQEGERDVNWNLQLENIGRHRVVTGIEYEAGVGLRIQYSQIAAWDERQKDVRFIRMTEQPVLTEIVDDLKGFRAHTAFVPAFPSRTRTDGANQFRGNSAPDLFFNTFRIGTFTGGWPVNTTKIVSQEWPASGRDVAVVNLTQSIPETGETLYVLFAPRTQDLKNPDGEVKGEDENPIPLDTPPYQNVAYYALEIQPASDCTAFTSLNGKLWSEIAGYDTDLTQALSHDDFGCPKWVGKEIEVVTDVTLESTGLKFTRKKVHVLEQLSGTDVDIPIGSVQGVYQLEFDGTHIVGKRKTFYAFNVTSATDTKVETEPVDALSHLSLGGAGLYADKNEIRVLKVTPLAPDIVDTTDCPPPGEGG